MAKTRTIRKSSETGRLRRDDVRAVVVAVRDGRPLPQVEIKSEPVASISQALTKSDLIQQLASRTDLTRAEAQRAIDALFATDDGIIAQALRSGEKVQITGFGSFETRQREARKGRNPRTGTTTDGGASVSATFRPGKGLKEAISH